MSIILAFSRPEMFHALSKPVSYSSQVMFAWIVRAFILAAGLSASCSGEGNRYRSIENLERPPELSIADETGRSGTASATGTTTESIKKGLDDQVRLDEASGVATMIINRPFEQAWFVLGVLLNQLKIETTDRNRDEGYFYVTYDPDTDYAKTPEILDAFKALFKDDLYAERTYALRLAESNGVTEVTASVAPPSANKDKKKDADEEPPEPDAAKDGPERLIRLLFKTLRDGLEKQSLD
ncbi:MAG: outer membrane protein assembly factor BamC [Gammaproteobacteria bacterium]